MNSLAASAMGFALGLIALFITRDLRHRSKLVYWLLGSLIVVASGLIASHLVQGSAEASGRYLFYFWIAYMIYAIARYYLAPAKKESNESREDA